MQGVVVRVAAEQPKLFANPPAHARADDPRDPRTAPALMVECVAARAMIAFQPAWSDLVGRVGETNVFLDPAFALPLLQHVRFARRPDFLLAWEANGPASFGKLVGLLPVHLPRSGRLARGFHHPQVTRGLPLLDRERGAEAFAAMLGWLGRHHPSLRGLVLSEVPADGAFHRALAEPALCQAATCILDRRSRAVLHHDAALAGQALLSPRRRKELRRQRRRLAEGGEPVYRSARTPAAVRGAAERFMALEASGWKGRRGSALVHDPSLATFTRTMTRLMAFEGRCRIDSLEVGGVPVAMGVLITAGTQAHFWKTTFDERYAPLSPGVHFALDLTEAQLAAAGGAGGGLTLTDSCAVPDHPMIDRLWSGRVAVCDLLIALPGDAPGGRAFRRAVAFEVLHRRLRRFAKDGYRLTRSVAKAALRWRGRRH